MNESKIVSSKISNLFGRMSRIMHKRIVPIIIYIILVVVTTVNVTNHGGVVSYAFFYVAILYLPISVVYIIISIFMLNIYQEIDQKIIRKNSPQKYQLIIENVWPFPISGGRFYYNKEITSFRDDFTSQSYNLSYKEKLEISTEMVCRFAGSYDAGIEGFYLQDLFGIIRIKKKVDIPVRLHVMPLVKELTDEEQRRLNRIKEMGNNVSTNLPDDNLGNDIRKYMQGDSLNTVHWKNYARTGEMYVRIPEKQETETTCLVLVTTTVDGSVEALKRRDRYLEYIVSIGVSSKHLVVYYYNLGVMTCVVDNLAGFKEFFREVTTKVGVNSAAGYEKELLNAVSGKYRSVLIFREENFELKKAYGDKKF